MATQVKGFLFSVALWALVPVFYLGLWHGCAHAGLPWPAWLNIPGLLILALAWPWSTSAFELVFFHGKTVGAAASVLIHVAVILGFGVNLALLSVGVQQLVKRLGNRPNGAAPAEPE